MSEWNDALEAAAKEVHRMLVGVPYFDNARANLLAGIRALKRPEPTYHTCAINYCITLASCKASGKCLAETIKP